MSELQAHHCMNQNGEPGSCAVCVSYWQINCTVIAGNTSINENYAADFWFS